MLLASDKHLLLTSKHCTQNCEEKKKLKLVLCKQNTILLMAWLFCNTPGKKNQNKTKKNRRWMLVITSYVIISYKQFCRQIPCKTAERDNRISSQWIDTGRSRSKRLHGFFIFMTEYTTFIWRNKSEVSPSRIQTRTLFFFFNSLLLERIYFTR